MDPHRRASVSSELNVGPSMQPVTKVVGFRVEGAAQSPSPGPSLLNEATTGRPGTGSPNPVLIPPAFQVQITCSKEIAFETARLTTRPSTSLLICRLDLRTCQGGAQTPWELQASFPCRGPQLHQLCWLNMLHRLLSWYLRDALSGNIKMYSEAWWC